MFYQGKYSGLRGWWCRLSGRPLICSHLELMYCPLGFCGVALFTLIVRMDVKEERVA